MKSFSMTDIGQKREINQDFIYENENSVGALPNLYIVADGMGGHNAGDFASRFTVDTFTTLIIESKAKTPIGMIEAAINETNLRLIEKSKEHSDLSGMGTTFVMATMIGETMYVANVGDSRLYLIREDIKQITEDHSLVEEMIKNGEISREEARFHPNKNVITRAIGVNKEVAADYFEVLIKEGDVVLLCSDGLSNMLSDDEMFATIKSCNNDLEAAGKSLIGSANKNGGKDNIAIIIVKI